MGTCTVTELYGRDPGGRFVKGNRQSAAGGKARAARLAPERRREIAQRAGKAGFAALVDKHFSGDREACKRFIGQRGAAVADVVAYGGTPLAKPGVYRMPVAPWQGLHSWEVPHDYADIAF